MTVNSFRRSLLLAAGVGGIMLASPGSGLPVVGGLVDSVVGIRNEQIPFSTPAG
jgi:hypothetical protein